MPMLVQREKEHLLLGCWVDHISRSKANRNNSKDGADVW